MNLPQAMGAITALNDCATFVQWVKSAFSFLHSKWSSREEKKLGEEMLRLESGLQRLREATLPAMYGLIDRAEWRSHVSNVAECLPALKDAVYDAEDLLDEFKWYELKMQVENNATPPAVEFFNSVVKGSFSRVDDIKKRLDTLSNELEKTGLRAVPQRFDESIRPKTSSFPTEKRIFGRDKELKDLISLLCVPLNGDEVCPKRRRGMENLTIASTSNQATVPVMTGVSVLPIVGIGGIGKTTLAQQISKHPESNSHFKKIRWVCVSDEFDVKRLTKDVIQSVSGKQAATDDLDSLQQALVRQLNKKRFLIILDDMWDDALKENGQCWKRFCAPLTNVVQGSMLLVTTRSQKVADRVGTMESFPLGSLNDEDFWDFFKKCAFGSDASHIDPELEQIGRGILGKSKGSPLAAKTLGRLLGMKLDTTHWNRQGKRRLTFCHRPSLHDIVCIKISQCVSLSTLPAEKFGSFPLLKDLSIWACPSLDWKNGMVLPSSLQRLSLDDCGDLSASFPGFLENLTSLELLDMSYCKGIVSIPACLWGNNLASLQELLIVGCQDLEKIGQEAIGSIKTVYIVKCPKLMEVNQPLIRGDINQRSLIFELSIKRQHKYRAVASLPNTGVPPHSHSTP